MGLADALGQDPRVELKTAEYASMIAKNVRGKIIEDAIAAGIPGDRVMQVLNAEVVRKEERELLAAYKETGLTPDQIYEIDKEYTDLSQKLAELKAEHEGILCHVKTLKEELDEVRKERDHFAEQLGRCATQQDDRPDPQQADKKRKQHGSPEQSLIPEK